MSVSYKKLFHRLVELNMSNAQLRIRAGFSANIMTRIKNDRYVSLESVEHICRVLNCRPDDILEFIPDESYTEREKKAQEHLARKKHRPRFSLHRVKERKMYRANSEKCGSAANGV